MLFVSFFFLFLFFFSFFSFPRIFHCQTKVELAFTLSFKSPFNLFIICISSTYEDRTAIGANFNILSTKCQVIIYSKKVRLLVVLSALTIS